jgi:spore coat protein CotH
MARLTYISVLALAAVGCGSVASDTPDGGGDTAADGGPTAEVFPDDRLIDVELSIDDSAYAELFDDPDTENYVAAELVYDGTTIGTIGVRLKGNSSFNEVQRSGGTRYSLKLDFDRFDEGLTLYGHKKLNLNNGFKDPTMMRERIAYEVFASLELPASRTAYARVYINGDQLGFYTVVEQVDKRYLSERLGDDDGDLYKPERMTGSLAYRGASIDAYPDHNLKTNETTSDHADLLRFVDLLNNTPDSELEGVLPEILDVDSFARYLAASTALTNLDSYQGTGHNYYIYFHSQTGIATIIPWDLNEAFGAFRCQQSMGGDVTTFPIDAPVCGAVDGKPLIDRVLTVPAFRASYEGYLATLIGGALEPGACAESISDIASLIGDAVVADPNSFYPGDYDDGRELEQFTADRAAYIDSQL